MSIIGHSALVQLFILEEDASVRISISETIEHLYAEHSKLIQEVAHTNWLFYKT